MTKKITFSLPAEAVEGASEAILLGDFNNWNPEQAPKLEKQPDGSFKTAAELEEGQTYHYRFLLNDGRWVNDYNAQNYVYVSDLYVDNCVITVPVSDAKENKTAELKTVVATRKNEKAATGAKAEPVKTVATKKAATKTKALATDSPKAKKAKSVDKKVEGEKVEKAEKGSA